MWPKFIRFWRSPLFHKCHNLSSLYYRIKGIVFYRLLFKKFGSGSYFRKPLLILNPGFISIGNNVTAREGLRIEIVRSNMRRFPQLTIEDNTNIEQNVHIVCHSRVHIGSNVSITGNCSIVDVIHPFADVHVRAKIGSRIQDEDSFVEIGDGSFIGVGAVVLPNVKIGKNVVIGANSVVNRDVPDYSIAAGVPAVVLKQYDFAKERWVRVDPISSSRVL